jgi:hypothetical protein
VIPPVVISPESLLPRDTASPSETPFPSPFVDASTFGSGSTDLPLSGLEDKAKPPFFT